MTKVIDDFVLPEGTSVSSAVFPQLRMRRLRQHPKLREMLREHTLTVQDMVLPLFIVEGKGIKKPITSMPGHYQLSVDQLQDEIKSIVDLNIPAVLLFGIPGKKDGMGSEAIHPNGIIQKATRKIKECAPDLLVITDVCFCEYTDHGHCGVVIKKSQGGFDVDNDKTLTLLAQQAVSHVEAGADVVAPSGMMDGMVLAIRSALDHAHYSHIPILSYAVKFASSFYGPFREAAEGAPQFGDRSTYQIDPPNGNRALREAELDVIEAADMLMVKPATMYCDVIYRIKQKFPGIPLCAYHVSGEFAMIKAAAEKGWIDEKKAMLESLIAIKRAGADFIISYFAKDVAALEGRR